MSLRKVPFYMGHEAYVQLLKKLLRRTEWKQLKFTLDYSVVSFHSYFLHNILVVFEQLHKDYFQFYVCEISQTDRLEGKHVSFIHPAPQGPCSNGRNMTHIWSEEPRNVTGSSHYEQQTETTMQIPLHGRVSVTYYSPNWETVNIDPGSKKVVSDPSSCSRNSWAILLWSDRRPA